MTTTIARVHWLAGARLICARTSTWPLQRQLQSRGGSQVRLGRQSGAGKVARWYMTVIKVCL